MESDGKEETKQIAPKLASGERRVSFGHGLPQKIKEGLRDIARMENKSMSWVMEEVIDYFDMLMLKYVKRKEKK